MTRTRRRLPALLGTDPGSPFPDPRTALTDPPGLLAIGGDLSSERLLNAYRQGIFPWFSEGQPLLWWSPDPRMVFRTNGVHLSRRFRRALRTSTWRVRADTAFSDVVAACASVPRAGQDGTWITAGMQQAYAELHALGHAHSVEVFQDGDLVGGIYGVAVGRMFFGESMFSAVPGGSKVALAGLAQHLQACHWPWIDAQVENDHLLSLGAMHLPRADFLDEVERLTGLDGEAHRWTEDFGVLEAARLANVGRRARPCD